MVTHIMLKSDSEYIPRLEGSILKFTIFVLNQERHEYYRTYCSKEKDYILLSNMEVVDTETDDEKKTEHLGDNSEDKIEPEERCYFYLMDLSDETIAKVNGQGYKKAEYNHRHAPKIAPNVEGKLSYYWERNQGLFEFLDFKKILN